MWTERIYSSALGGKILQYGGCTAAFATRRHRHRRDSKERSHSVARGHTLRQLQCSSIIASASRIFTLCSTGMCIVHLLYLNANVQLVTRGPTTWSERDGVIVYCFYQTTIQNSRAIVATSSDSMPCSHPHYAQIYLTASESDIRCRQNKCILYRIVLYSVSVNLS